MSPLGIVVGDVVADFELGFGQVGEAAAVEQSVLRRLQNDSAWVLS